jgi:glucoamylase
MSILPKNQPAPSGNTTPARWTRGAKDGIGTAASSSSLLWYTISEGVVTEVYYPTVDSPQIRDLQLLVTDGQTFFHDGRRNFDVHYECLGKTVPNSRGHDAPAYRIISQARGQPYRIVQDVLPDPRQACLLLRVRLEAEPEAARDFLDRLHVYVLLASHIEGRGEGNNAYVSQTIHGKLLLAQRGGTWLALGASVPFSRCSCGYVGINDGWTDIVGNQRLMSWEFDSATQGNVALTGELDLTHLQRTQQEGRDGRTFGIGLAFGMGNVDSEGAAARVALAEALSRPFADVLNEYLAGWGVAQQALQFPAVDPTGNQYHLYRFSYNILLSHEDKIFDGAFVASLSIPWGDTKGDQDEGYHLVWPRDMCNTALALLAAGETQAALRALIFLSCVQQSDGRFYQNFFLDGRPYWRGLQLDEVAFPILLAYQLHQHSALNQFDPLPLVLQASAALIALGPKTPQERWEENSGYSPSTLAVNIAGLICAVVLVRARVNTPDAAKIAVFLEEHADFLETKLEDWTVTRQGDLVPGISEYYVRISDTENPDQAEVPIRNGGPTLPARHVVDAGFLELVRYGIRAPDDRLIVDSLKVVDAILKVNINGFPCWKRYNNDGYGQHADGSAFDGTGRGGPWPLLSGERGHYEVALALHRQQQPPTNLIKAMEHFTTATGILPEQIWDLPAIPKAHMYFGKPTGSAVPLAWAHAEYIKLVRSAGDKRVVDLIPEAAQRYSPTANPKHSKASPLEVWNFQRPIDLVARNKNLRIVLAVPFRLHWSGDGWQTTNDTVASAVPGLGLYHVDIPVNALRGPLLFTFFWTAANRWEGRDFQVELA